MTMATPNDTKHRHDVRCPHCQKFVPEDADGFYDSLDREDEIAYIVAFCNERCADQYHAYRDNEKATRTDTIDYDALTTAEERCTGCGMVDPCGRHGSSPNDAPFEDSPAELAEAAQAAAHRLRAAQSFRASRLALGLTWPAIAQEFGVTERTVARWEAGTSPIPLAIEKLIGRMVRGRRIPLGS
jgi:DNA-binding transcriptional regulator YiaG